MIGKEIIIHTDGGARGNPGPAASAFVAAKEDEVIFKESLFLGNATNNVAEYRAVILALEWLNKNPDNFSEYEINFCLDSELVVRQLNGIYKVKDQTLQKLFKNVMNLIGVCGLKITFRHVLRAENKMADFLVNEELDKHQK
jgi:ribonuclease HI